VSDATQRALERLTRELREQSPPAVDWPRVERGLELALERAARRKQRWRAWAPWMGAAAAAAALLFWAYAPRPSPQRTPQPVAGLAPPGAPLPSTLPDPAAWDAPIRVDGDRLAAGMRVDASRGAVLVTHGRRAAWVLSQGGLAQLLERGARLTVGLEAGEVRVVVEPGQPPESFAVEAGNVRVAVQGTIFAVTRRASRVDVVVERGTVSIGGVAERGTGHGWLLAAPERATLDLQGALVAPDAPWAGSADDASRAPRAGPSVKAPPGAPTARPGELESALYDVTAAVQACFARYTPAAPEGHITAEVTLSVAVGADGAVTDVRFTPPLAPKVASCSEAAARQRRLPAPGAPRQLERTLTLLR
jgi:hypothetical protein